MHKNFLVRPVAAAIGMAIAASNLTGCHYLARQDLIEPYSGDAPARNLALQTIDPWPPGARDTHIPANGQRQADAYRKYASAHEKGEPQPIAPVQLVLPPSN